MDTTAIPRRISAATIPAPSRRSIRVLPEEVAARIAAGEVVERPASVVKELIENALDAGSRQIRVEVRGGGLTLIRVSDDGAGIPAGEMRLACQRHATSKLPGDDLSRVRTLGFRGEALPSIAAVAELTLVSAADDSGIGRRLTLRAGRTTADEPAPRTRGTTVTVRQLFQNLPARLAASSRPQSEIQQIGQTVRRLALAAPDVRLALYVEGRSALRATGSGDLATAMTEIYGSMLAGQLLPLDPFEVAGARVHGVVGSPALTRPGRGQVNVLVNGRWVQPRGLLSLLEAGYRAVLPRGRHPVLTLVVEVDPELVDINIHPAKAEVRLLHERAIGRALGERIAATLGRQPAVLTARPALGLAALAPPPSLAEDPAGYDDLGPIITPGLPPLRLIGQVQRRLVMLEGPDGLYLVDQHRAHERIIYDRLVTAKEPVPLPEPLPLDPRAGQLGGFEARLAELAALGFACERFGGQRFLLRAAPPMPGVLPEPGAGGLEVVGEPEELAAALIALTSGEPGESEDWRERVWVQLACRTALRRGRPLDGATMRALIDALGRTSAPAVCPHGSPLLMHVSGALFEREFGWR